MNKLIAILLSLLLIGAVDAGAAAIDRIEQLSHQHHQEIQ